MIGYNIVYWIKNSLKSVHIIIFTFIMVGLEFVLHLEEDYPHFYILLPLLVVIMVCTILVLKSVLSKVEQAKLIIISSPINKADLYKKYIPENSKSIIPVGYMLFEAVYFICLYKLNCIPLNIMGMSILFFGGITFLLALIGYEIYIRITILISEYYLYVKKENFIQSVKDIYKPSWLIELYKLSKHLILSAMVMGFLFIIANNFILVANAYKNDKLTLKNFFDSQHILESSADSSAEYYIICFIVFVFIVIMFPVLAVIQHHYLKLIVEKMSSICEEKLNIDSNNIEIDLWKVHEKIKLADSINISLQNIIHVGIFEKMGTTMLAILSFLFQIIATFGSQLSFFN